MVNEQTKAHASTAYSWGRLKSCEHQMAYELFSNNTTNSDSCLPWGNGRSYGDQCTNHQHTLVQTRRQNKVIDFDIETGILTAQAGLTLQEMHQFTLAHGWFAPVTPGTEFVTLGGAVANDVHGKNHHQSGSFGCHVLGLLIDRSDGQTIACSAVENADWFAASIGGMGLTGLITHVTLALKQVASSWVSVKEQPFFHLQDFFTLSAQSQDQEYTVAWVDCSAPNAQIGRGLFSAGKHSHYPELNTKTKNTLSVPFTPPCNLISSKFIKVFNTAYFHKNKLNKLLHPFRSHTNEILTPYQPYFYPLDGMQDWNKLYGPKGFYQYQCVIPKQHGFDAILEILQQIKKSKTGSMLAVLKCFGEKQSPGLMSFPMAGVTLAIDLPNLGQTTLALMDRLDKITTQAGGRVYLAKDARLSRETFEHYYPQFKNFLQYKDPNISSDMYRRLMETL